MANEAANSHPSIPFSCKHLNHGRPPRYERQGASRASIRQQASSGGERLPARPLRPIALRCKGAGRTICRSSACAAASVSVRAPPFAPSEFAMRTPGRRALPPKGSAATADLQGSEQGEVPVDSRRIHHPPLEEAPIRTPSCGGPTHGGLPELPKWAGPPSETQAWLGF